MILEQTCIQLPSLWTGGCASRLYWFVSDTVIWRWHHLHSLHFMVEMFVVFLQAESIVILVRHFIIIVFQKKLKGKK